MSRIDKLRRFLLTDDRRLSQSLLEMGNLDAPGLPESFGIEESEGGEPYHTAAR
jgi:hypothetical protein